MFLNNKEPTSYDSNNPDEWKSGNNAEVKIDHWVNTSNEAPIVLTSLQKTTPHKPSGGGKSYPTLQFTFRYTIPLFDDKPWDFTKTGRSGGVKDWSTPVKPNPDDHIPDPVEDGGWTPT